MFFLFIVWGVVLFVYLFLFACLLALFLGFGFGGFFWLVLCVFGLVFSVCGFVLVWVFLDPTSGTFVRNVSLNFSCDPNPGILRFTNGLLGITVKIAVNLLRRRKKNMSYTYFETTELQLSVTGSFK